MFRSIWTGYILPLLRRPPRYQVAAMCYRVEGSRFRILLLTSRESRRWVLPKGWPKMGLDAVETALDEAWEEGGVHLEKEGQRVGRYTYRKRMRGGVPVGTEVDVFAFRVLSEEESFPEAAERNRRWVDPEEAAQLVDEPELADILRDAETLVPSTQTR